MKSLILPLCLSLGFLATACSVKNSSVTNEPPKMRRDLVQFDAEYGVFKIESATVFLWPEVSSEAEVEEMVKTVNTASERADLITLEMGQMMAQKGALEAAFGQSSCVEKWADLGPDEDPIFVEWVTKWKTSEVPEEAAAIKLCMENQEKRRAMMVRMDEIVSVEQPKIIGTIFKTIDPGYPEKVENMKSLDAKGSKLVIRSNEGRTSVNVTLKDFLLPGHVQSTETMDLGRIGEAMYRAETKLLLFSVPELNKEGKPTGDVYRFFLERCPDFGGFARFKGDVKVYRGAKIVRYGSAKFDAKVIGE